MTSQSQADTGPDAITDSDELPRMYRGYDDDHDAETLSDFGLDLSITEHEGVLVPPSTVEHLPLHVERGDEFPVEHVIVQPIGVGPTVPSQSMFEDVDGTESVFVHLHPVREYDLPGHYVQAESRHTVARVERSTFEKYCDQHTVVQATDGGMYHWQDPTNDPHGYCDDSQ